MSHAIRARRRSDPARGVAPGLIRCDSFSHFAECFFSSDRKSAIPPPVALPRPALTNCVAINNSPSGVGSRSSGWRVPQRTSISLWPPNSIRAAPQLEHRAAGGTAGKWQRSQEAERYRESHLISGSGDSHTRRRFLAPHATSASRNGNTSPARRPCSRQWTSAVQKR